MIFDDVQHAGRHLVVRRKTAANVVVHRIDRRQPLGAVVKGGLVPAVGEAFSVFEFFPATIEVCCPATFTFRNPCCGITEHGSR